MTLDDVEEVNVGYQPPQLLVEGRVDVYPVFLSNEPDTIRRKLAKRSTSSRRPTTVCRRLASPMSPPRTTCESTRR